MEFNSDLPALPKGWVWTRVGDVISNLPLTNRKLKKIYYLDKGKYPVIDQGKEFIGGYTNKEDYKISSDIPLIVFGDHTKVFKYINFDFVAGADGIKVIRSNDLFYPKLFYFFAQAIPLPEKGYARHFQWLEKSFIPLPPLPEQYRIVNKIEELFTKLDAGVDALKKIKIQLKRYRQAVLKNAFEGNLTQQWREAHKEELEPASVLLEKIKEQRKKESKGKFIELPPIDTSELPELPEGWVWTLLENCVEILDNQRVPVNSKDREKRKGDIPYYGATGQVGWIDDFIFDDELILLGEDGSPFLDPHKSKAYIIRGKSWVNNHAHVLKAIFGVTINAILCHYLNIFDFHNYVSGTTRLKLNQSQMRQIPIPLPPLLEQHQIVAEIESRLSVADQLEKVVEQSLKQAERLRKSILKQAFEGKLVPQDPTDEPAEKLLERIKEEKESRGLIKQKSGKGK